MYDGNLRLVPSGVTPFIVVPGNGTTVPVSYRLSPSELPFLVIMESPLNIYTDGSCEPNPGYGGWAAIIIGEPGEEQILTGTGRDTTNNRMEFEAPLAALKWMEIHGHADAIIHSDSRYVVDSMTTWVWGWEKKGWVKKLKNLDLIQPLHELQKKMRIEWQWVRGHNGHPMNERVDKLAEATRIEYTQEKKLMSLPGAELRQYIGREPRGRAWSEPVWHEVRQMDRAFDEMFRQ